MDRPTNYRKCSVCGHEWVRRDKAKDPKRCPNEACRSKKWAEGIVQPSILNIEVEYKEAKNTKVKPAEEASPVKPMKPMTTSERLAQLRQNR
jgi:hypothetical protein